MCFSLVYDVLEEDVFKHLRYCDEFSHLMDGSFRASLILCSWPTSIKIMFWTIDTLFYEMPNLWNRSKKCFFVNLLRLVVDVFKHPRFCDEFSHLMNGRFLTS